jgi:hypothetical protein
MTATNTPDSPPPAALKSDAQVVTDPSNTKAAVWLPIIVSVSVAVGGGIGWLYERVTQDRRQQEERIHAAAKENERLVNEYLVRIQVALDETKVISDELYASYLEPRWGIMESYVIKARREGHDKNALMFRRISRLVHRNGQILSLLEGYHPYILSEEFKKQSAEFRDHAQRYIDRWEAVPQIVVTKEQLPVAKAFPSEFPAAVQREIEVRKSMQAAK